MSCIAQIADETTIQAVLDDDQSIAFKDLMTLTFGEAAKNMGYINPAGAGAQPAFKEACDTLFTNRIPHAEKPWNNNYFIHDPSTNQTVMFQVFAESNPNRPKPTIEPFQ